MKSQEKVPKHRTAGRPNLVGVGVAVSGGALLAAGYVFYLVGRAIIDAGENDA